jgi:FeS assembly SUF system protein
MAQKTNFLELESKIVDALKTVFDPEIPVNIYELGLIYEVRIDEKKIAHITMTVTAPNCPVADTLPIEVHNAVKAIEGIFDVDVVMTFDPPWNEDMMTDEAKLELGLL